MINRYLFKQKGGYQDPNILRMNINGVEVTGRFTYLDKFNMEVEITRPYINWRSGLSITGPAKMNPENFLWKHEEVGKRVLKEIYFTLRKLENSMERYSELYGSYLEEKRNLKFIDDKRVKRRMEMKIEDWFFQDFPHVGILQREQFKTILLEFLRTGTKIYLSQ